MGITDYINTKRGQSKDYFTLQQALYIPFSYWH